MFRLELEFKITMELDYIATKVPDMFTSWSIGFFTPAIQTWEHLNNYNLPAKI